jgi:fibronectin type 3 domain-containing protein
VEVTWASVDAPGIAGYRVCRAVTTRDSLLPISALQKELRFTDPGADFRPGTQYRYAVRAVSTSNVEGRPSADVWVRPKVASAPPAPRSMHARAVGNAVWLNWSDAREDDETVLGYSIYRFENGAKNSAPKLLGRTKSAEHLSWGDSSALPGRAYVYAIAAFDAAGNEGIRSRGVEAAIVVTLLAPPAELHAVRLEKAVRITWDDPGEDEASSTILYRRERGKPFTKLADLPAAALEYSDAKAKPGTVYFYALSRVDKKGQEGPKSPEARAAP